MGQGVGTSCRTRPCHFSEQGEASDILEASPSTGDALVRPDQYREELLSQVTAAIPVIDLEQTEQASAAAKLESAKRAEETKREIMSTREEVERNSHFFKAEASEHEAFFAKQIEEQRRHAEESRKTTELQRTTSNSAEAELRGSAEKKISSCKEQSRRLVEHAEEQRRNQTEATRQLQEAKTERLRHQGEAELQRAEAEIERQKSFLEKQRNESTSREGTNDNSVFSNSDLSRLVSPDRTTTTILDGSTASTCAEQDAKKDKVSSGSATGKSEGCVDLDAKSIVCM